MIDNLILKYLVENGKFDSREDASLQTMNKKKDILKNHNHNIHYDEKKSLWKSYLGDKKPYKQISAKTKEGLEEKIIEYYLAEIPIQKTFGEVYQAWVAWELNAENPTICPKSVNNYKNVYANHIEGSRLSNLVFAKITAKDLRSYIRDLVSNNCMEKKRFDEVKSLIGKIYSFGMLEYDVDFEYSYSYVFRDLKFNASQFLDPTEEEKIYYAEEIEKLVSYVAENPTLFGYSVLLNLELGLRVSEMSCLSFENFFGDHFRIMEAEHSYSLDHKRVVYIDKPKRRKTGNVFLTSTALLLWDCITVMHETKTGYVLLDSAGERMTTRQIDYHFGKLCKAAGIKNKGFHKLRITCSSTLLGKLPESLVRDNLRHADVATTKTHYGYNPNNASATAAQFSNVTVMDITGHYRNLLKKNASNADLIGI